MSYSDMLISNSQVCYIGLWGIYIIFILQASLPLASSSTMEGGYIKTQIFLGLHVLDIKLAILWYCRGQ